MSFILVTYGYNQYALFNTKTSTPTLIDNIKNVAFQNIVQKLTTRDTQLQKEVDSSITEEENTKKVIKGLEQELQVEEDKYNEACKQLEAKKKKEEAEEKKRKEKEKKQNPNDKKKDDKKTSPPTSNDKKNKKTDKKQGESEIDNKPILDLKEKLAKLNNDLQNLANNRNIYLDKKKKLQELLITYKKKFKEKNNIKIDLVDEKQQQLLIYSKGDDYASEFLLEKGIYELHSFNVPKPKDDKNDKKNPKDPKKKEEKKKEESKDNNKKEDKKEDKKEEEPVELVLEPVKFDGYCFRSIKEDEEFEESDKGAKDKKPKKK